MGDCGQDVINIDTNKCTSCATCYDVCPNYVIRIAEVGDKGGAEVKYPSQCCECGHCISLCPSGAITGVFVSLQKVEKLEPMNLEPDALTNLMFLRRSVRNFKPQAVPKEIIERLLQVARHAGTSSNEQSEGFIVIQDREFLRKLERIVVNVLWNAGIKYLGKQRRLVVSLLNMRYGPEIVRQARTYYEIIQHRRQNGDLYENDKIGGIIFRNAPAVIVVHGERRNALGATNSALAVRNMELLALTLGLGTCWVGFLVAAAEKSRQIDEYFELPKNRTVYGALMIGYSKYSYMHKIPRKARDVRWI